MGGWVECGERGVWDEGGGGDRRPKSLRECTGGKPNEL